MHDVRSVEPPAGTGLPLPSTVARILERSAGTVVAVHAPPGYGKTTTIATWVAGQDRPTAWVELDNGDNDAAALVGVLAAALQRITDFDSSELPAAQGTHEQYSTTVAPAFGRLAAKCTRPFVLVLDDVHVVDDPAALDLVAELVRRVPAESTVVLVSRDDPHVALARLRADGKVVDVTAAELALDVPAARGLLAAMGVELDDADVSALVDATEGWAVGLRLAGLALRDDPGAVGTVTERALGHDEAVVGYVSEEWLRGSSPEDIEFLVEASWLDSLSASFCNDVLGRTDAGDLLQRMHHHLGLVIPLRRRGTEFRMHRLLRAVLLAESERLPAERRQTVEHNASLWCEQAGDIDGALRYALRASDMERAEQLVSRYSPEQVTQGRYTVVQRWLEAFPQQQLLERASLCLITAAVTLGLGEADTTLTWLRFATQAAVSGSEDAEVMNRIVALRAMTATSVDDEAMEATARARRELSPGPWHAVACVGLGQLSFATGDASTAVESFTEAAAEAKVVGATTTEVNSRAGLALAFWESGDQPLATVSARAARTLVGEHGLDDLPILVLATAMSALVEAAAGDVRAASADIALTRRNLAYVSAVGTWTNVQARLALARASLLLGDRVAARTFADEAEAMLRDVPSLTKPREQLVGLLQQLRTSTAALPHGPSSLTTAELRVLHYLPTNLTLTEIARRLYVSRNTAKSHAASVYRKLGVSSRGEAVEVARSVGLLAPGVADPSHA